MQYGDIMSIASSLESKLGEKNILDNERRDIFARGAAWNMINGFCFTVLKVDIDVTKMRLKREQMM